MTWLHWLKWTFPRGPLTQLDNTAPLLERFIIFYCAAPQHFFLPWQGENDIGPLLPPGMCECVFLRSACVSQDSMHAQMCAVFGDVKHICTHAGEKTSAVYYPHCRWCCVSGNCTEGMEDEINIVLLQPL